MTNTDTGQTYVNTTLWYDATAPGNGDIAPGGAVNRQYSFALPDGTAGTGHIQISVTVDYYNYVQESNENNNTTTVTQTSILAPLPDLTVTGLAVAPSPLGSGDYVTVTWNDNNSGTATTARDSGAGLLAKYYPNTSLSGTAVLRLDPTVNYDFTQPPGPTGPYPFAPYTALAPAGRAR